MNSQNGSEILEFQLLILRVRSWSNLWISCQVMLEYDLIVIAREKDYRCVLLFHFLVERIP